MKAIPETRHPH